MFSRSNQYLDPSKDISDEIEVNDNDYKMNYYNVTWRVWKSGYAERTTKVKFYVNWQLFMNRKSIVQALEASIDILEQTNKKTREQDAMELTMSDPIWN